jgi:hypothetical protein
LFASIDTSREQPAIQRRCRKGCISGIGLASQYCSVIKNESNLIAAFVSGRLPAQLADVRLASWIQALIAGNRGVLGPATLRQNAIFASRFKPIGVLSPAFAKISLFQKPKSVYGARFLARQRGVRAIATDVGSGSDGRFGVARRAALEADGKIVWS